MISEPQEEQATLYTLGLLDTEEASAFERELDAAPELRELVRDLRETIALLAFTEGEAPAEAPTALRERVLAGVKIQRPVDRSGGAPLAPARTAWLPWAIAALFMGCSGALLFLTHEQNTRLARLEATAIWSARQASQERAAAADDPLARVSFCTLEPTPDLASVQPRATVLWDAARRQGKLRISRLAPPADGKDYQLWAVEAGRKEAVSAGVVHVDADGKAELPFQPADADGKPVVAVAISLERSGGSPTNQGPILLLGKF